MELGCNSDILATVTLEFCHLEERMENAQIDRVIDALHRQELEKAVLLVKEATGSNSQQALEVVKTLVEGLDEAEARGIQLA